MFERLALHRKIVVTGPPRSGTRICSKMIAADTRHTYVDEFDHGWGFDEPTWRRLLELRDCIVVQSPGMVGYCVDSPPPGVFIVLMRRPVAEIHASERRIDKQNGEHYVSRDLYGGDSALAAYTYWDTHKKKCKFMEVRYSSLANHPLWIEDREGFTLEQTE